MTGGTTVALSEILNTIGLTGEVTAVTVSNAELFSASKDAESAEWSIISHKAFSTEEWMMVTINDVVYEITVTDDGTTEMLGDHEFVKLDDNQYAISTVEDLNALAAYVNAGNPCEGKTFQLQRDITYEEGTSGNNFTPIGNANTPFQGSFAGCGYTISGICITGESENRLGLFGQLRAGAEISNVVIADMKITAGGSEVGAIAGAAFGTSESPVVIRDCEVCGSSVITASGSSAQSVGGIIGHAYYVTLNDNKSSISIVGSDSGGKYFGGIVGYLDQGSCIDGCTADGVNISAYERAGGIFGYHYDRGETIQNCFAENCTITRSGGESKTFGALFGSSVKSSYFSNNYYLNCSVNGMTCNCGEPNGDTNTNSCCAGLYTITNASADKLTLSMDKDPVTREGVSYYPSGTTVTLTLSDDSIVPVYEYYDETNEKTVTNRISGSPLAFITDSSNGDITVKAYEPTTYKVHFDPNRGSGTGDGTMQDQELTCNLFGTVAEVPLTLNAFTRLGYTFDSWNTKADGSGTSYADCAYVKNLTTAESITLYAQWTPIELTVNFFANGNTDLSGFTGDMDQQKITYDSGTALNANQYALTGYHFTGWNTSVGLDGETIADKADGSRLPYQNTSSSSSYMSYLYATWAPNSYTVTLDGNGYALNTEQDTVKTLAYGESYYPDQQGTRAGYVISSWNTQADGSGTGYTSTTQIKNAAAEDGAEITLYAQYAASYYDINDDYENSQGSVEINPTIQQAQTDTTVYLRIRPKAGIFETDTVKVLYGESNAEASVTKIDTSGLSEVGNWEIDYEHPEDVYYSFNMPPGDVIVSVTFKYIDYTVTYDLQGGSWKNDEAPDFVNADESTWFNLGTDYETVRAGYSFIGWTGSNGSVPGNEIQVKIEEGSTGNRSYTANWTANTYSITPADNISHGSVSSDASAATGATVTLTVTPDAYYMLDTLTVNYEGGTEPITPVKDSEDPAKYTFEMTPGNAAVSATFKPITYNITYDLDGGELAEGETNPSTYTVESGDITLNNPSKTGYTFAGWTGTDLTAAAETVTISTGSHGDRSYTATWTGRAYVSNSASYDEKTGKFTYTIKVTADGNLADVNVKGSVSGDVLVFDKSEGAVTVTGNSSSYTDNKAENGFDYTFDSMEDGEVITIGCTADVNFGADDNNDGIITADQTKFIASAQPEMGEEQTAVYSREITYITIEKSAGTVAGIDADGNQILEWTITYNPLALVSVAGKTVTDQISDQSSNYMTYYGDGITVKVCDKEGTMVRSDSISYEDLTGYNSLSWTYTIPETDTGCYSYEITYNTVVNSVPEFKVQSLRLSGEIGVNFYMDLSMLTEEQREASYVLFTVGSSTNEVRADYDAGIKNRTDEYYGFTCYVNAIQMADTITATYHYTVNGTEYTVEKTYSVQQYIDSSVGDTGITDAELTLIKAIKDYGYYSQQYLSELRGFTIGSDYAGTGEPYATSYNTASIKADTEKYKIVKTLITDDISKMTYSLALDSNTSIYLYVKLADGYSGNISATVNDNATDAVLRSDGRYRITISGISAHKLGDTYEVKVVTQSGTSIIKVSAMSYVYACLDQPLSDKETNAVDSLYSYYTAAVSYKNAY